MWEKEVGCESLETNGWAPGRHPESLDVAKALRRVGVWGCEMGAS